MGCWEPWWFASAFVEGVGVDPESPLIPIIPTTDLENVMALVSLRLKNGKTRDTIDPRAQSKIQYFILIKLES